MKITLSLLISLLLLSSCAKKSDNSEVSFDFNFVSTLDPAHVAGGIMLFGKNSEGASFSKNISDNFQDVSFDLPKGLWSFHALTWESPGGQNMSGKVRCASLLGADLTSPEVTIDLNFSNTSCDSSEFSPVVNSISTTREFPKLLFSSCSKFDDPTVAPGNCASTSGNRGFVKSFRISFVEHFENMPEFTAGNSHLRSQCYDISGATADSSYLTNLNIPAGNGVNPFAVEIEGFAADGCNPGDGLYVRRYLKGFGGSRIEANEGQILNSNLVSKIEYNAPAQLHLRSILTGPQACELFSNSGNPFSTGDGTFNSPYGICFPEQFNMVQGDTGYLSSNFILLKDLDFKHLIAGFPGSLSAPECAKLANNIIPWGGLYSAGSSCVPITTAIPFSGSFNGNHKTMKNILFMDDEFSSIGLFREVSGSVYDLSIENAQFEAGQYVGSITGKLLAGGSLVEIIVKNVEIDSRENGSLSYAGGAVGFSESSSIINNLKFIGGEIRSRGSYVGGVTGKSNGDIADSTVNSIVSAFSNDSNQQYIGGLVGYNAGLISTSSFHGGILGSGTRIGGLAGYNSSTISQSYTRSAVVSTLFVNDDITGLDVGGAVGHNDPTGAVTDSYFIGSVTHQCAHPSTLLNCRVGEFYGTNAGTDAGTYSLNTVPPVLGGSAGTSIGTVAQSLDPSFMQTSFPDSASSPWVHVAGAFPRLVGEAETACYKAANISSIGDQVTSGRGGILNPVTLCNAVQASDIANFPNLSYKLLDNIFVGDLLESNKIAEFSGTFLGNNKILHGIDFISPGNIASSSGSGRVGFFSRISTTGQVRDLTFVGVGAVSNNASISEYGVVTGRNLGLVDNVNVIMSNFSHAGAGPAGVIAGSNMGTLSNVKANFVHFPNVTTNKVGGIVGENQGQVTKAVSFISANLNSGKEFGGIAGYNTGLISQIRVGADIQVNSVASTDVGAITGINLSGAVIEDAFVEDMTKLQINVVGESKIGAAAGNNLGEIRRVVSLGKVQNTQGVPASKVGSIAGQSSGNILGAYASSLPIEGFEEVHNIDYNSLDGGDCKLNLFSSVTNSGIVQVSNINDRHITYQASASGSIITISGAMEACDLFSASDEVEITRVHDQGISNYTLPTDLSRHTFYCPSAPAAPSFDADFRCTASQWDMLSEHDIRGEGNGFNHIISRFQMEFLGESTQPSPPMARWIIEEGRGVPEPFFDW